MQISRAIAPAMCDALVLILKVYSYGSPQVNEKSAMCEVEVGM